VTAEPRATRPHMPGYGIAGPASGTGLLPWSWAVERLSGSHDYWLATAGSSGQPHVMPVWGVWLDGAVCFSSGLRSRKARDLAARPACTLTTDDAQQPVVVEGTAEPVTNVEGVRAFAAAIDAKYGTDYGVEFYDPALNGVWRVAPVWAFGLVQDDFTGSPTRWTFG